MRLLLALCLTLAVAVVTITPASAEPSPGFMSWLQGVRDRIQHAVDKYRPRILEIAETYNGVRDTWKTVRDMFRGRRSVGELEYSVTPDVDVRGDQLIAELDALIESIVAEVITDTVISDEEKYDSSVEKDDNSKEYHGKKYDSSVEKDDNSKEDHGKKYDSSVEKEDHGENQDSSEVENDVVEASYHPKALTLK